MSHEHFNSKKFVENALEMFDSYGWALDNCKMYEKYFYLSDKSRKAKGHRRWDEQRYKRSGGLAVFDSFNSSTAKSHCMNDADSEKDEHEGASGHRPSIDYDTSIKEDFVNFMEMRTEKLNKKKLGANRPSGRMTAARKDSTRSLSTMSLEDLGEEKRYNFRVSIKKKRDANRRRSSRTHKSKPEQYCTRDAIARPMKKFELTPMTFVRAKDKASLPHQDCVLIEEEERIEMESAKFEQQKIEGVEGNFPIGQVESQIQLESENEYIKYELPEYDLDQVIKSRSKFKFKVKHKDSFSSTRETTRGLATGARGSNNVFTYVHTLKKKGGFTVDDEYLLSSTHASGVDSNQGKIQDVPGILDNTPIEWAASDSNRRSVGRCTRAKTNDFSGRISLTSAGGSENPVDSLGSALSSMSLDRDGVPSPNSYARNKYCDSRAGRNRPKQGTPPEESPFLDVGILRKKSDNAYSLWIATLPKSDQTSDPIPDQSLGLGSALESVSTALFMAEPTPESATVEPTPRPVAAEAMSRPVVAEPTSRPVMAESTSRSVVAEPTPRPAMVEPTSGPVVAEPTSRPIITELTPRPAVAKPTSRPAMVEPTPRSVMVEPTSRPAMVEPTPRSVMVETTSRPAMVEPTSRPAMVEPTPRSVMVEPTSRPAMVEPTPRSVMVEPTSRPAMVEPTPRSVMVEPTPRSVMVEPTSRPAMVEPTPRSVMAKPTSRPAMVEPTPRSVMVEPTPRSVVAKPTSRPAMVEPTPRSVAVEPTRRPVVTELKPRPVVGESTSKSTTGEPMPRPAVAESTLERAKTEPTSRTPESELIPTLVYDLPLPTFSASMSCGSIDILESESAVGYCPLSEVFKAPVIGCDEPLVSENDFVENELVGSGGDQQTDDESEGADKYLSYEELKYLNDVIRRFICTSPVNVCMVIEKFNEYQAAQFRQLTDLYRLKWRAVCRKNRLENSIHVTSRTKIPGAMAVDRYIRQIAGGASASANEPRRSNRPRKGGAAFYNGETKVVEPGEIGEAVSELSDEQVVFGGEPDFVRRPAFRRNASAGFLSHAERRKNQKKKMALERLERMEKKIPETNIGYIMMSKMGWNGGGLGKEGQGLVDPIKPTYKQDRIGLREVEGAKLASLDVQQKILDIVPRDGFE
ncbi:microtubule-associated protein futsch-like [Schistocerca gregaria]|uniref:microtubule-associated protein futsch-like n=1 Tax=Schistocerca gregaria TaxID=7010 RepID=UPI00211DB015|nr:microtubule-associated protein futsch-like [Schistocerca gregaria]